MHEFILITGRELRNDTFSKLKHRDKLVKILEQLNFYYDQLPTIDDVSREFILKNLEGRKAELAVHGLT